MLIKAHVLDRIETGDVRTLFRRWASPRVRVGSSVRVGRPWQLDVLAVTVISPDRLAEQALAGSLYDSHDALRAALESRAGDIYRIDVRVGAQDARLNLRETLPSADEVRDICERLAGFDRRSRSGPWTQPVLRLIHGSPATRAAELAIQIDQPLPAFKRNVRKLKELGLTESLEVGYKLSPRGEAVWAVLAPDF